MTPTLTYASVMLNLEITLGLTERECHDRLVARLEYRLESRALLGDHSSFLRIE